jgi:hypothetical protein
LCSDDRQKVSVVGQGVVFHINNPKKFRQQDACGFERTLIKLILGLSRPQDWEKAGQDSQGVKPEVPLDDVLPATEQNHQPAHAGGQ